MAVIANAGKLGIPFTTGILIGIGESISDRVDSLFAIRELHDRYGHIQEAIIQNFRVKPGIPMSKWLEPSQSDMLRTTAVARLILRDINLQAPPNLSAPDYPRLLDGGINDWGGISPVTRDYVNPEAPWPEVAALGATCEAEGFVLRERLAIYPEYVRAEFLDPALAGPVDRLAGAIAREGVYAVAAH